MIAIFKDNKGWSKMMEVPDGATQWIIQSPYISTKRKKYWEFEKDVLTEDGFTVFKEV